MNASTSSLPEMISQSITVITKPSVQSFEAFERRGTTRDALIYVGAAALVAGIVSFLFGLLGGITAAIGSLIAAVLGPVIGFAVFAYITFYVGRQQGGTGTQDEVFYSLALLSAPLLAITGVVSAIPIIGCLALPLTLLVGLYQIYLTYLAIRASMNLQQNQAIITGVVAYIAYFLVIMLIGAILAGIGLTAAAINS